MSNNNILYDTGNMAVTHNRHRTIISKTDKSIRIDETSLYSDCPPCTCYYKDGGYPNIPADWTKIVNSDYHTTAYDCWIMDLSYCTPYRTIG